MLLAHINPVQAVAPIMAQSTADMESPQHYMHTNLNPNITIVFPDERYNPQTAMVCWQPAPRGMI